MGNDPNGHNIKHGGNLKWNRQHLRQRGGTLIPITHSKVSFFRPSQRITFPVCKSQRKWWMQLQLELTSLPLTCLLPPTPIRGWWWWWIQSNELHFGLIPLPSTTKTLGGYTWMHCGEISDCRNWTCLRNYLNGKKLQILFAHQKHQICLSIYDVFRDTMDVTFAES